MYSTFFFSFFEFLGNNCEHFLRFKVIVGWIYLFQPSIFTIFYNKKLSAIIFSKSDEFMLESMNLRYTKKPFLKTWFKTVTSNVLLCLVILTNCLVRDSTNKLLSFKKNDCQQNSLTYRGGCQFLENKLLIGVFLPEM